MSDESVVVKALSSEYEDKDFKNYFQIQRHEMLEYIPKSVSILLDVGCSSGSFGQLIKATHSVEVWGIEPNKSAAEIASQTLDKVICGAFDSSLNLPEQSFDCIVFNDVLEHLVNPKDALTYCQQLLKNKGVIVASIPNVRYFDNIWNLLVKKDWEYTESGILDKTHLRFFTNKSIVSTFDAAGYEVELIEGINPLERIHPYLLKKFRFLNRLLFNNIEDMRYLQFAVVARPKTYSMSGK